MGDIISKKNLILKILDDADEPPLLAAAVGIAAAAAASSPPPMNMFPTQGAPQPGTVAAGGGVTPAAALAVRVLDYVTMKIVFHGNFMTYE